MRAVTLPSGIFVELRRPTWLDHVAVKRSVTGCEDLYMTFLLARIALFDGVALPPVTLLGFDYADITVAVVQMLAMVNGPITEQDEAERLAATALLQAAQVEKPCD